MALSPRLADLVTILYRPRETMRRILDSAGDFWTVQIVLLAFALGSVNEVSARRLSEVLPDVKLGPALASVALGLIIGAIGWLLLLYIVAGIALPIGRMLGGTATFREIAAALAWALTPVVWSPIYRIPAIILTWQMHLSPQMKIHDVLLDFFAHGGCSLIIMYLMLQFLFEIACVVLGSFTLAEAQRFSTEKGFVNVVSAILLPLLVIVAAVFTFRS